MKAVGLTEDNNLEFLVFTTFQQRYLADGRLCFVAKNTTCKKFSVSYVAGQSLVLVWPVCNCRGLPDPWGRE